MPARILVVTEDPNLQRQLSQAFMGEGHEVLPASSGPDGLRRWSVERPDGMVLDAVLPGFDGYELVGKVREAEGQANHVPMIMLGADSDGDVAAKVRGLRAGADDHLTKPIHSAELVARMRGLLVRFAPREGEQPKPGPIRGQVHAYYGAKGGVGTTTMAVNAAVALHRIVRRKVCLVDADLQFGDHRVFLDLGQNTTSLVDAAYAPAIDAELLRHLVVHHESGIDVMVAPPTPEAAEQLRPEQLAQVVEALRTTYDYVVVDLDKRLDDHSLDVIMACDTLFVVMTADLSCIKNVRLVLETMTQLGMPDERVQLFMNRSNAYTGISVKSVEGVLRRPIRYQVVNDYRVAITALNSGEPFMQTRADSVLGRSVVEFVKAVDGRPFAPSLPAEKPASRLVPALT